MPEVSGAGSRIAYSGSKYIMSHLSHAVWRVAACVLFAHAGFAQRTTQRVNPADMERSPEVARPGPIDPRLAGAWDVWISGAVTYNTDGRSVYQRYEPGAAMNRLEIAADGRYRWGSSTGRLVEVLPWHHQPERRYYRVVHSSGVEYDFYYGDGDRLVILFGGAGGHASTGTRLAGGTLAPSPAGGRSRTANREPVRAPAPSPAARAGSGNPLGVEWAGSGSGNAGPAPQQPAGNNPLGVEWAGGRSGNTAPQQAAGSNPLGVEWRTGSSTGNRPPAPAAGNPLGVEWAGAGNPGGGNARPQPNPTRPQPQPVPPQPVRPEPPAPPVQGGAISPSTLAARWMYEAVAFTGGSGTVSETSGVSGSLTFKSDGRYEQALYIGGILNAIAGTYRVAGSRIITNYDWNGRPASDEFIAQLDASGDRLTLVGNRSPKAYYTLRRAD